jgi:pimeloyl-ACP methyl ester carboxylesterase
VLVVPITHKPGVGGRFRAAGVGRQGRAAAAPARLGLPVLDRAARRARPADPPCAGHAARAGGRRERQSAPASTTWPIASCRCPAAPPGLRDDTQLGKRLRPYALENIRVPTLVVSARDDGFGTYAAAEFTAVRIAGAKFIGYERGGHLLIGHDEEIRREIVKLLITPAKP